MTGEKSGFSGNEMPFSDGVSFLHAASHELKSPLALVRQLALGLDSQQLSAADQERVIQQIILVSERALRLTADLSKTSRLEDSLFELEPCNPIQICEEVAHELSPLYVAKGKEIRVEKRQGSLLAVANRDLLRRVLLNFGDNALHYAADNAPVELKAGSREHGGRVRIGVRDYGPMVPATIWKELGQRLGARPQILHARPQSSGLGLYLAGQFAAAMNGSIGAVRHRDGATFYVDVSASTQMSLL